MKNLLSAIKKSFDQVKVNGLLYLMTNLFFQLVRSVLLLPFFSLIFKGVLKSAHIFAVTNQTFSAIFAHPLSFLLMLLLLFCFSFFSFYELAFYFLLAHYQVENKPFTLKKIFLQINSKWKSFFSFSSLLFLLYFFFLALSPFGLSSQIMKAITIPNFIIDELLLSIPGKILYATFLLVSFFLVFRLLYSVYYFVIEEKPLPFRP